MPTNKPSVSWDYRYVLTAPSAGSNPPPPHTHTLIQEGYFEHDTKLHLVARFEFLSFELCWVTYSLPLLPGVLEGVILVMVSSTGQIDLMKNSDYLIGIQETINLWKLFVLNRNTWNHITLQIVSVKKLLDTIVVYKWFNHLSLETKWLL